jgi:hypothetical protein
MNAAENSKDPWFMLRFGDKNQGLTLIREAHGRKETLRT